MAGELLPYDWDQLSPTHEFFTRFDFWDRLSFATETSPRQMRAALYQADISFVKAVIVGDVLGAYQALCDRYESSGHKIEFYGSTGDRIGPLTLEQCLEFADFFEINDPRLDQMRKDCDILWFIHGYENLYPGEAELLGLEEYWSEQLTLFDY